ncbi:MAG: hypothetical protein ABSG21_14645 [Spirochaetia bacterium]|jgi:hypothetical protein
MGNALIQLIQSGKLRSFEDLKSAYHRIIMKTHPDAVGSDKFLKKYLQLSTDYEDARAYLADSQRAHGDTADQVCNNHRLAFFRQLHLIESLETPYAFHPEENRERLLFAKNSAMEELHCWRKELAVLYVRADKEYVRIKMEKPEGPYLKHALALNVRPLVHNLIGFHLTGRDLYMKQAKQNLSGIMHQLAQNRCAALREFLSLLLDDMANGPAVLD